MWQTLTDPSGCTHSIFLIESQPEPVTFSLDEKQGDFIGMSDDEVNAAFSIDSAEL